MTGQSVILICTLAAMFGLWVGYGLGWLIEALTPVYRLWFGIRGLSREVREIERWVAVIQMRPEFKA